MNGEYISQQSSRYEKRNRIHFLRKRFIRKRWAISLEIEATQIPYYRQSTFGGICLKRIKEKTIEKEEKVRHAPCKCRMRGVSTDVIPCQRLSCSCYATCTWEFSRRFVGTPRCTMRNTLDSQYCLYNKDNRKSPKAPAVYATSSLWWILLEREYCTASRWRWTPTRWPTMFSRPYGPPFSLAISSSSCSPVCPR